MSPSKILFQLTGSIACYKACQAISALVQEGHEVQVVVSTSALQFVGKATLEGLTSRPVLDSTFEPGRMMEHINLARWADLAILCPATAHSINKLSQGLADDLIGSLFLAFSAEKPYLVAPAMNVNMLSHPATQESIQRLNSYGVKVLKTGEGSLACGESGAGRLLEPTAIVDEIHQALNESRQEDLHLNSSRRQWPGKVLITSGGTREFIDGVRYIGNISSGRTGATLAEAFYQHNWDVLHVRANHATKAKAPVAERTFNSFSELNAVLQEQLAQENFDAVIHLAAVSDFSIAKITSGQQEWSGAVSGKLDSQEGLNIELKKNFKILNRLKAYSRNPGSLVVGFKLTNTLETAERQKAIDKVITAPEVDFVVHNDLNEMSPTDPNQHKATIYAKTGSLWHCSSKDELAEGLITLISKSITRDTNKTRSPFSNKPDEVQL